MPVTTIRRPGRDCIVVPSIKSLSRDYGRRERDRNRNPPLWVACQAIGPLAAGCRARSPDVDAALWPQSCRPLGAFVVAFGVFDEVNRFTDLLDLLGRFIGDTDVKLFFEFHH